MSDTHDILDAALRKMFHTEMPQDCQECRFQLYKHNWDGRIYITVCLTEISGGIGSVHELPLPLSNKLEALIKYGLTEEEWGVINAAVQEGNH